MRILLKSLIVGTCSVLLCCAAVAAQQDIAAQVAKLDQFIENARQTWKVPGLSVGIVHDGKIVLNKGYGIRRDGSNDLVTSDTLFAIASNTKAFTTAALSILVERGKLNWDDRVRQHLPYFELYDSFVSDEMRVRDLVCHRSGLGTFSGDLLWYGTPYSSEEIVRRARFLKPEGRFRDHYGYSNLMFIAAGEVIAKVSGKPWSEFVRDELLLPLGMNRTKWSIDQISPTDDAATPHKTLAEGNHTIAWSKWDSMMAAGGLISSSTDMSQWIKLQLRQGELDPKGRLFSQQSSNEMWAAHTIIPIGEGSRRMFPGTHFRAYGLGWALMDQHGKKIVSHGGGYDGMYSCVMMVPEAKLGVVILTNSMTSLPNAIAYQVVEEFISPGSTRDFSQEYMANFLKDRKEFDERISKSTTVKQAGTSPSHALSAYIGKYRDAMYGDAEVLLVGDRLQLKLLPNPDLVADLSHMHFDTFQIQWQKELAWFGSGACQFELDIDGSVKSFRLDVPNDDLWFYELHFERVPAEVATK